MGTSLSERVADLLVEFKLIDSEHDIENVPEYYMIFTFCIQIDIYRALKRNSGANFKIPKDAKNKMITKLKTAYKEGCKKNDINFISRKTFEEFAENIYKKLDLLESNKK